LTVGDSAKIAFSSGSFLAIVRLCQRGSSTFADIGRALDHRQ